MKMLISTIRSAALGLGAAGVLFCSGQPARAQVLYVSDGHNDAVEAVEVRSGVYIGPFVHSSDNAEDYKITGPRGVIFAGNKCIVMNQDVGLPIPGEVLAFDANTGMFMASLVPFEDPHAPFAPRGVIAVGNSLYVADAGNFDTMHPGQVLRYSLADGSFQGRADTTGFDKLFAPRGLVLGPDGLLYVSVTGNLATGDRAPGYVVRFQWDTATSNFKFKDVFVASDASNNYAPTLHRPEGLVFGPDGNLYVTTFLQGSDLDGVVAFNSAGQKVGRLNWWMAGQARVFAQAILFGPGGDLFVPLTSDVGVRRYAAASGYQTYSVVPRTGKSVREGWYLSFRETNPATLAYEP